MESYLDLIRVLSDSTRPAHERAQAGRTLAARVLKRCQEIDKEERVRLRAITRRAADAYAARRVGEA